MKHGITMLTPLRVIVNGASGKMGTIATQTLHQQSDFNIVAELGKKHDLEKEIQRLAPDFVVDLTNADAIRQNMQTIIKTRVPAVIGTTGLSAEQIAEYKQQCDAQKQGVILAPNFSISVLLMMKYAEDAARYFSEVEIIEMHHPQKLDAPSGTARKTARMIAKNLQTTGKLGEYYSPLQQDVVGANNIRPNQSRGGQYDGNHIPIHAIRLSGKMAHQQIIFGSIGETFTLQQDTLSRECFMPGFLVACRAIRTLNHFVEGLENILWPSTDH